MATYRGMDGSLTYNGNPVAEVTSWNAQVNLETLDKTKLGDKWQGNRGGLGSWSGQITGHFDYGDTNGQKAMVDKIIAATPADTATAVELIMSTGKKITGNILISGLQVGAQIGQLIPFTFSFVGDGAPAISWV